MRPVNKTRDEIQSGDCGSTVAHGGAQGKRPARRLRDRDSRTYGDDGLLLEMSKFDGELELRSGAHDPYKVDEHDEHAEDVPDDDNWNILVGQAHVRVEDSPNHVGSKDGAHHHE